MQFLFAEAAGLWESMRLRKGMASGVISARHNRRRATDATEHLLARSVVEASAIWAYVARRCAVMFDHVFELPVADRML